MLQPPEYGIAPPLTCSRLGCKPEPATWHIMWDSEGRNGLCCDEHMEEARKRWVYLGAHPYEMTCSMPGAVFYENCCVVDEDGLGLPQPRMAATL